MIYKAFINAARDSIKTNDYITFRNCGWNEKLHIGTRTYRPEGRSDYLILYLSKGKLVCNGQNLMPGQLVIYRPYEPQEYICTEEDSCSYWLHCYGDAVDNLLGQADKLIYTVGEFKEFTDYCIKTLKYCHSQRKPNRIKIHGDLLLILCKIEEKINKKPVLGKEEQIALVAEHMASNFSQRLSNEEYAKMCNMSKFHFIRKFTEYYKSTPKNYLNSILMNQAGLLLSSTNMRVSQIAEELGFTSDMYFSTVFKKYYGMSPLEYRKNKTL